MITVAVLNFILLLLSIAVSVICTAYSRWYIYLIEDNARGRRTWMCADSRRVWRVPYALRDKIFFLIRHIPPLQDFSVFTVEDYPELDSSIHFGHEQR